MNLKPLIVGRNLFVFCAVNYLETRKAIQEGRIPAGSEVSEPIIVLANSVDMADYVLKHSTVRFDPTSDSYCTISHYLQDNKIIREHKPFIRLVIQGEDNYPTYLNN